MLQASIDADHTTYIWSSSWLHKFEEEVVVVVPCRMHSCLSPNVVVVVAKELYVCAVAQR